MLKISKVEPNNHAVTLRLEGRIVGPWVEELRQVCHSVVAESRTLQLQLADVDYVDAEGVALLVTLRSRDVSFADPPPFITEQLKATDSLR